MSPIDLGQLHGNDIAQWRMAQGAHNAITRGMDGAATLNQGQRLLARIESAAKELGMRIAEYDEYMRSSEGAASMAAVAGAPAGLNPQTNNGSQQPQPTHQQQ